MITKINTTHILSVKALKAKPENSAAWRNPVEGKKWLFFFWWDEPRPGGYGYELAATPEEWIKKQHTIYKNGWQVVDNKVFVKPRIEVEYLGGKYTSSETMYFDTEEETLEQLKTISTNFPHITIGSWEEQ